VDNSGEFLVSVKLFIFTVVGALSALLVYLGLDREVFAIFSALLVTDYILGIGKAISLKESVTSNKAKYGILSKMSLLVIPIVLAASAKAVGQDASNFFFWGMNLLIFSEAYSIIGNIYAIRTKKELPEWDVIALMGKKIRERFGG